MKSNVMNRMMVGAVVLAGGIFTQTALAGTASFEKGEKPTEVVVLEKKLAVAQEELAVVEKEIAVLKEKQANIEAEISDELARRIVDEKKLTALFAALDRVEQDLRMAEARAEELRKEIEDLKRQLSALKGTALIGG